MKSDTEFAILAAVMMLAGIAVGIPIGLTLHEAPPSEVFGETEAEATARRIAMNDELRVRERDRKEEDAAISSYTCEYNGQALVCAPAEGIDWN